MEMDDAWGFEVNGELAKARSPNYRKWEGEDEEDCVMDSWDQEPEDCEGDASATSGSSPEQSDESGLLESSNCSRSLDNENCYSTPQLLDKLQLHTLQKEADLNLAEEVFGVRQTVLDSEESYIQFKTKLLSVIDDANKNVHYTSFTEDVVQNLCNHLTSNELKKIVIRLSNLQIQKNSSNKKGEKKKQKGKLKVKLRVEDDIHDYSEYSAYLEDDGYM
uniref:Eukaryotic translation initiation factor 3 subunit J n=2 Tax=Lygus hesperus TaxID=30085 RepID=A0A0A9YF66_LYGHE